MMAATGYCLSVRFSPGRMRAPITDNPASNMARATAQSRLSPRRKADREPVFGLMRSFETRRPDRSRCSQPRSPALVQALYNLLAYRLRITCLAPDLIQAETKPIPNFVWMSALSQEYG
jgi:hypothetical protein